MARNNNDSAQILASSPVCNSSLVMKSDWNSKGGPWPFLVLYTRNFIMQTHNLSYVFCSFFLFRQVLVNQKILKGLIHEVLAMLPIAVRNNYVQAG